MPEQIATFLAAPFSPEMSATRWFLFIGLLLAILWGWHMVFRQLTMIEGEL
jgi:hypothetical protein